ncbi:MAG: hypothetical protein U0Y10_24895 [Spirosomataceae bacterium]
MKTLVKTLALLALCATVSLASPAIHKGKKQEAPKEKKEGKHHHKAEKKEAKVEKTTKKPTH